jgi:hypothetical protein
MIFATVQPVRVVEINWAPVLTENASAGDSPHFARLTTNGLQPCVLYLSLQLLQGARSATGGLERVAAAGAGPNGGLVPSLVSPLMLYIRSVVENLFSISSPAVASFKIDHSISEWSKFSTGKL